MSKNVTTTQPDDPARYACPRCQIGVCQAESTTYTRIHKGRPISVPDMTRYVCDVCGFREVDPEALYHLLSLLVGSDRPTRGDAPRKPVTAPLEPKPVKPGRKAI